MNSVLVVRCPIYIGIWALMDSDNDNDGDDKNIVGPNQWKGVGSALG